MFLIDRKMKFLKLISGHCPIKRPAQASDLPTFQSHKSEEFSKIVLINMEIQLKTWRF